MHYVPLGKTGIKVSRICLGTMNFGVFIKEQPATKIIRAALDDGVNFIDTADCYGSSELIVGKALKGHRDKVVLATKGWLPNEKGPNGGGGSRYHMMRACERSLKRLGTDHIDLYIVHRPDREWPGVHVEETLSAMTDLVRQGKVRYIGCSSFNAWRLTEAQWVSRVNHLERFCCDQMLYNMFDRFAEKDILRVCQRYDIGVNVFTPLCNGWLAGKYVRGKKPPKGSRGQRGWRVKLESPDGQQKLDQVAKLLPLAEERGISLSQFALAWLLKNPVVTTVISGPRLLSHWKDNVKADEVELDDAAMAAVDEICSPKEGPDDEWW